MKRWHKIVLGIALVLFVAFLLGSSEQGQVWLRGPSLPDETPFQADDRYMGAGLAPIAFCLVPSLLLLLFVGVDVGRLCLQRRRRQ